MKMNYWIFKANPNQYRIDDRLMDPNPKTTWRVTRYRDKIRTGDIAFIWRTGNPRGIIAMIKIETNPHEFEELEHERQFQITTDFMSKTRVKAEIVKRFPLIEDNKLKQINGLIGLSVFAFQQATNYPVNQKQAEILLSLINKS
jgi:hypothetical protein